ncbi:MAG: hypothetical protein Q7U66_11835 [Methylobacter sp.]|nr:hypothetical protein [Methylobacter sp.]
MALIALHLSLYDANGVAAELQQAGKVSCNKSIKKSPGCSRNTGFDLVQGGYYERYSAPVFLPKSSDVEVSASG